MKRLFALLLVGVLLATPVMAGSIKANLISETILDDSPTFVTGATVAISGCDKVGIYVNYDETDPGSLASALITFDVSYDGTTWIDAYYHDFAGGATAQTSETVSADTNYYAWLDGAQDFRYIRALINATGTSAATTATVSATLSAKKQGGAMIEELALKLKELIEITSAKITELASKIAAVERKETESNDFIHKLKEESLLLRDREARCIKIENIELAMEKLKDSNSQNAATRELLERDRRDFESEKKETEEMLELQQEGIIKSQLGIEKQQKQLDKDIKNYKAKVLKEIAQEAK